jgi:hypothetical protein
MFNFASYSSTYNYLWSALSAPFAGSPIFFTATVFAGTEVFAPVDTFGTTVVAGALGLIPLTPVYAAP